MEEQHLNKTKVLDLFFNFINQYVPLFDRSEFESLLVFRSSTSDEQEEDPYRKEVYVLYLTIKALCEQRIALSELAEETAKKARDQLAKVFDIQGSFHIACAYVMMSVYESGCGRNKVARFYLSSCRFYLSELSDEELNSSRNLNLRRIVYFATVCCKNDEDLYNTTQLIFESIDVLFPNNLIPPELKYALSQRISLENYQIIINVLDNLFLFIRLEVSKNCQAHDIKFYETVIGLISNGLKLSIIRYLGLQSVHFDILEQCALNITDITLTESLFIFIHPPTVAYIAATTNIHLDIVKTIEKGERINPEVKIVNKENGEMQVVLIDYYDILAKDLRALNLLSKRFKKVELLYSNLLRESEEAILRNKNKNL